MKRYRVGARFYDLLSGEWPVYRAGRLAGLRLLRPPRGAAVLDIGCGTGLNLPMLARAVGPEGLVIGLDASAAMLDVAKRRVSSYGSVVRLLQQDATHLDTSTITPLVHRGARDAGLQAMFSSYALSVVPDWHTVWAAARELLDPGARVGVVDMRRPDFRPLRPLAALACAAGGADLDAAPWRLVQDDCTDVATTTLRRGHIVAAAGRYPGQR